jgi:predicted adenine nucleotide alpha hydrolase (AANH) superfamily ATPase
VSGEGIPPEDTATLGTLREPNGQRLLWWPQNWRKGGLQERRNFLIKSCALYNQSWCGCEFSHRII